MCRKRLIFSAEIHEERFCATVSQLSLNKRQNIMEMILRFMHQFQSVILNSYLHLAFVASFYFCPVSENSISKGTLTKAVYI